jgi:hypothetical protein
MLSEGREGKSWLALLEKYEVDFAVLTRRSDGDLVMSLRRDSRWMIHHQAEGVVFFERRPRSERRASA